jgi:uncharacterized protein (DUF302 family)
MTEVDDGLLTEIASPSGFGVTLQRVTDAIEAAGLTIFARIDHAGNARAAGLAMPPATVLIYGNAKGGTPLMLAAPRAALDLPLRVLVRETEAGAVVAFHPIAPTLLQAGVPEAQCHRLDPAQRLLEMAIAP